MNLRQSARLEREAGAPDPRALLESLGAATYDWSAVDDRLTWGPSAARALGRAAAATGRGYDDRVAPASGPSRTEAIRAAARDADSEEGAYATRYALDIPLGPAGGARRIWVEDAGRWFAGPDGAVQRAHGCVRLAGVDAEAQTVADRARLMDAMEARLARGARFCLLLTAADPRAGSGAALAGRFSAALRAGDRLARLAPDEFAVLLGGCDAAQMEFAAARLLRAADPPAQGAIAIGGACAGRDGRTAQALLRNARAALDNARGSSPAGLPHWPSFAAFDAAGARKAARLRAIRAADTLVDALNDRRIDIDFRSVLCARTRATLFHAVRPRLRRDDGALLPLPLPAAGAERGALDALVDYRMLELAVARLAAEPSLALSVPASGATLRDPDWPARVRALAPPALARRLIIEIEERDAVADVEATAEAAATLRARGARIAIGRFGGGSARLADLRRIGCDWLAIDGAFVRNLAGSADDRFHVRALIENARALEARIAVDRIETDEIARLLGEWGVDGLPGDPAERAVDQPVWEQNRSHAQTPIDPGICGARSAKNALPLFRRAL